MSEPEDMPVNELLAQMIGQVTAASIEVRRRIGIGELNHLVAGANDYGVCCDFLGLNDGTGWAYTSFDGGLTWTNVQVPGLTAQTGEFTFRFNRRDSPSRGLLFYRLLQQALATDLHPLTTLIASARQLHSSR